LAIFINSKSMIGNRVCGEFIGELSTQAGSYAILMRRTTPPIRSTRPPTNRSPFEPLLAGLADALASSASYKWGWESRQTGTYDDPSNNECGQNLIARHCTGISQCLTQTHAIDRILECGDRCRLCVQQIIEPAERRAFIAT
jgi:hypothetical protein